MCQVPALIGKTVDEAKNLWKDAPGGPPPGFKPNNLNVTIAGTNFNVGHEQVGTETNRVWDGTLQDCKDFSMLISP